MRLDIFQAFTWLIAAMLLAGVGAFLFYVSPLAILAAVVVLLAMVAMFVLGLEAGRGRVRQIRVIPVRH